MVKIAAGKGLSQGDSATAMEEGRDYILWYFGTGTYVLNRKQNTGAWIMFQGMGAALPNAAQPIYALRDDGTIFRGSTDQVITTGSILSFDENYNSSPNAGPNKVYLFKNGNWQLAP
jgi:hypothetical protein